MNSHPSFERNQEQDNRTGNLCAKKGATIEAKNRLGRKTKKTHLSALSLASSICRTKRRPPCFFAPSLSPRTRTKKREGMGRRNRRRERAHGVETVLETILSRKINHDKVIMIFFDISIIYYYIFKL